MAKRQVEIDGVCKPKLINRQPTAKGRIAGRLRSATPGYVISPICMHYCFMQSVVLLLFITSAFGFIY